MSTMTSFDQQHDTPIYYTPFACALFATRVSSLFFSFCCLAVLYMLALHELSLSLQFVCFFKSLFIVCPGR